MTLAHERLEVYQVAIGFVAWSQGLISSLPAGDPARAQLERACTSIPLNIAEGNGKSSAKDRARYWRIALGSAFECAATLDVLVARGSRVRDEVSEGKENLKRIAEMLVGLLRSLGVPVRC
jgi:four helix bundle protein